MMRHLSALYGLPQINRKALNPPCLITKIGIYIFLQKFKIKSRCLNAYHYLLWHRSNMV